MPCSYYSPGEEPTIKKWIVSESQQKQHFKKQKMKEREALGIRG